MSACAELAGEFRCGDICGDDTGAVKRKGLPPRWTPAGKQSHAPASPVPISGTEHSHLSGSLLQRAHSCDNTTPKIFFFSFHAIFAGSGLLDTKSRCFSRGGASGDVRKNRRNLLGSLHSCRHLLRDSESVKRQPRAQKRGRGQEGKGKSGATLHAPIGPSQAKGVTNFASIRIRGHRVRRVAMRVPPV